MNADEIIRQAAAHHNAGRLDAAEPLYRSVLQTLPRHVDALHLFGVLTAQRGKLEDAARLIGQAAELRPYDVEVMKNLGRVLFDLGKITDSLQIYKRVTELLSTDPMSWYAYGLCLSRSGDIEAAITALRQAVQLQPRFGAAYGELGNLLRTCKQFESSVEAHRKSIQLQPSSPDAFNNLGNALKDSELYEEAIKCFMRAIEIDPNRPLFHINLGNALGLQDAFSDALQAYEWAIHLDANSIDAHCGKAQVLAELRQFDQALAANERAIVLQPDGFKPIVSAATIYVEMQQMDNAARYFRRAVEIEPTSTSSWKGLGGALRSVGKFDEANVCFREALRLDPEDASIYQLLATTGREPADLEIDRLTEFLADPNLSAHDRISSGFALGKYLDDANRFDEAFLRYAEANNLHRSRLADEGHRFDPVVLEKEISGMIEVFTPAYFEKRRKWGSQSNLPVFIVGMPRSGTTLVEQILASHSQAHGAGELLEIGNIAATLSKDKALPAALNWVQGDVSRFANMHIDYLKKLDPASLRVVDKMPVNIMHLGAIATLFPNARVIFSRRDIRDNCLSCYFQLFKKNNILFSYDLEDCATQYLQQERLRTHWLKVLPLPMLTLQYEELVGDLEGQSRRLLEFVGLPWEPACLDFHKTERPVSTASVWQVRQPLYNSSVGRWQHYQKHLGPLLKKLEM